MAIKDLITELNDLITDARGKDFTYSDTDEVPNVDTSGLTYESGNEKKGKKIKTCVLYVDIRESVKLIKSYTEVMSLGISNNKDNMKDDLKDIFKNVNNWLKFAEAKNAMLLGFNGALLFGVFKLFIGDKTLENLLGFVGPYYHYVFPVIIAISTIIILVSFLPETNMIRLGDNKKPKKINLLFYTHLKTLSADELLTEVGFGANQTATKIEKSYAQQIIINSGITAKKYDSFKVAGWLTIIGLMLIVPAIFLLISYYKKRWGKKEIE